MLGLGVATGVLGTGVSGASYVLALKKDRRELLSLNSGCRSY